MDKTKIAVDVFNKHAQQYQEKFMDVSLYKESLDIFCATIKKENATILELACGPGNITKYLLDKRPDFNILATDLAPNMIELARKNNPKTNCKILDARDLLSLHKLFDGIMCGFCLPYLTKEEAEQLVKDASKTLLDEGVLYLSTMEDDYTKSGLEKGSTGDKIFMHYYQGDYLMDLLRAAGFAIEFHERKISKPVNKPIVTDLMIVAKKLNSKHPQL